MPSAILIFGKIPPAPLLQRGVRGDFANKGNPPLQKGGRGDFRGLLIQTCLILLALLLFVPAALAQTPVSGAITSNAHWTVADGPYLLSGDVSIQNGAALTIDAGATVYMGAKASLTVQAGSIQALGTAANPIRVLSDKTRQGQTAAPGDWKQWGFDTGAINIRLDSVEFAHGSGLAVQGSAPVFNYLNIHDQLGAAITIDLAASPSGVGNKATGNTINGISVPSGDITGNVRWGLRGIPYLVSAGVLSVGVSPVILSVTPNTVEQGQTLNFIVNGTRLDGAVGSFDFAGLLLTASGSSGSQANFQLTAAPDVSLGAASLRLQTDAGELTLPNAVTVTPMLPAITVISPTKVLAGAGPLAITVTGRNFLNGSEVLFNAAAVPTQVVSATQLIATLPNQTVLGNLQAQVRFPEPLNPSQYRLSNSIALSVEAPVPPTIAVEPTPIALPPDNKPHNITVRLSKPDYRENTLYFSVSDTAKALVTPSSVVIPAGQTSTNIIIQPVQAGTVSLSVTSNNLQSVSVPIFITTDFRGVNTSYSPPVGIVVATDATQVTRQESAMSASVGITTGAVLTSTTPQGWIVGDNPTLSLYGENIPAGVQVSLTPNTGIVTGPVTVGSDGRLIQVSFDTASDAAIGPRKLTIKDASGNPIAFTDPSKAVVQIMSGMPSIDSIEPLLAIPGSRVNLTIHGHYLNQGMVSLFPAAGINVDSVQTQVSADGRLLTAVLDITAAATANSRIVQVTTPAGATPGVYSPANTFTVVNGLGGSITPIASGLVGVKVGDTTSPPTSLELQPASLAVGVLLGSAITEVSPNGGVIGSTATVTLHGTGLDTVTSVALQPAAGTTVGSPSVNESGTELIFRVQIDLNADLGGRLLVLESNGQPLVFMRPSDAHFLIANQLGPVYSGLLSPAVRVLNGENVPVYSPLPLQPLSEPVGVLLGAGIGSVSPNVGVTGTETTLTLRGVGLQEITAVSLTPSAGVTVGSPQVNANGTELTVNLQIDANATLGTRRLSFTATDHPLPLVDANDGKFLISEPIPELDSVSPQVLLAGQSTFALTARGRRLTNIASVRIDPAQGVTVTGPYTSNADGTVLNFYATVAEGAASGLRTVIVTTAAGDSSAVPQPANSIRIASQLGASYAGVLSTPVGVVVGGGPVNPEPGSRTVASAAVGVAINAVAQTMKPDGWLQGASGNIGITGFGLDTVTAVSVAPATGITLGVPVSSEAGTRLTIPVTVATDAPLVTRRLRLSTAGNAGLAFVDAAAALFGIGSMPTMNSVAPIFLEQGKGTVLIVRGSNLGSVTRVAFEPPEGLSAYAGVVWSQDSFGELLTVPVSADPSAPLGDRVLRLQVPGGSTPATATPANTLKVVIPQ